MAGLAGKEFAMERGVIPSKHTLPVIMYHNIVNFDKDFYETTFVLEQEITQRNLMEFKNVSTDETSKPLETSEKAVGLQDTISQHMSYDDMASSEFTELSKEKDIIVLYYFSEFWFNGLNTQAVEDFDAMIREFSKLENPKIKFVKFDMAKNYPNAMNVKMAESPILRLHSYKRQGGFIDLYYAGESDTEMLEFVLESSSDSESYKGKISLPQKEEDLGETDL